MLMHPDMGFVDGDVDLQNPDLYAACGKPFGEASAMPRMAYISDVFQQLENEKVWTRDWICIGSVSQVARAGDLLPYTIGEHAIHVQRTADGDLVGRFNKAQHGGCRAVPAQCRTGRKTKCSFTSCGHSRDRDVISGDTLEEVAQLAGQYLGMVPERLLPVKIAQIGGLLFANVDPTLDEDHPLPTLDWDADWTRQRGAWRAHLANWKVAGKALLEAAQGRLPSVDAQWVFPNLVLLRAAGIGISVILQPTAMDQVLWRVSYFAAPGVASDADAFAAFDAILADAATAAEAEQAAIDTARDDRVVEHSQAGWAFNQALVQRLVRQHAAYWNVPLMSARAG